MFAALLFCLALLGAVPPSPTPSASSPAELWRAAEKADHEDRDYARAVALYDQLRTEHPSARLARGAATRREYIARAIAGPGGEEPFRRFEVVRATYKELGLEKARAEIEAIRAAFPAFPLDDELLLWLGDRAVEQDDHARARDAYQELADRHPSSPLRGHALAGVGRASFELGDYRRAEAAYESVAGTGMAGARYVSETEITRVRRHVDRAVRVRWVLGFLAVLAVAAAATVDPRKLVPSARRAIGREMLYVAPVLGALVLIAPADARGSLAAVAAAGIAYLWAALLWVEAARLRLAGRAARLASTFAATAGGAAVLYAVLYALDLLVAVERAGGT